jgi:beta-glucuronidase
VLYPIQNAFRTTLDLSGLWKFRADPTNIGEQEKWFEGFDSDLEIAVPGSWNEQLEEAGLMHYVGSAWYFTTVTIPVEFEGKSVELRVGSADYHAKVWVNGACLGENHFGFLPFSFPLNSHVRHRSPLRIAIRVSNELSGETIPQGISSEQYQRENRSREETYPPARFDFSPFGGLHRPVKIVITPRSRIEDIKVQTFLTGGQGTIVVAVATSGAGRESVKVLLDGNGSTISCISPVHHGDTRFELSLDDCRCWSPDDPFLYTLTIQLQNGEEAVDEYTLPVGVRVIAISGGKLLLNGKQIYLQGFGKHEDAYASGKGLHLPLMVKDFQIMKWIGANSFRTSHYPYAEEIMCFADRKGILVIDEVPAVSLDFRCVSQATMANHKEFIRRLVHRDGNHPSVIMWALGNEPNLVGESGYMDGRGRAYWKEIFSFARELDPVRPMVVPNCLRAGIDDPALEFSDVLCLNRYYGWYEYPGQLEHGLAMLGAEMDRIHGRYGKPMMLTEFGADTIPGLHSTSDQMFTEEFQERLLAAYICLIRSKEYTIGEHVWNFADFRTPQNLRRVVLNMKGVFTRTRSPKMAAFTLRKIWLPSGNEKGHPHDKFMSSIGKFGDNIELTTNSKNGSGTAL